MSPEKVAASERATFVTEYTIGHSAGLMVNGVNTKSLEPPYVQVTPVCDYAVNVSGSRHLLANVTVNVCRAVTAE